MLLGQTLDIRGDGELAIRSSLGLKKGLWPWSTLVPTTMLWLLMLLLLPGASPGSSADAEGVETVGPHFGVLSFAGAWKETSKKKQGHPISQWGKTEKCKAFPG